MQLHRILSALVVPFLCVAASLREASASPQPHAIFSENGEFMRIENIDTSRIPPIPVARDGAPRAVPVKPAPEFDAAREAIVVQRDGTQIVVALPTERREAIAREREAAAAKAAQISAARAVRAKLKAGTALTAAELQAVVRLLALEWLDTHAPEEAIEAISEAPLVRQ